MKYLGQRPTTRDITSIETEFRNVRSIIQYFNDVTLQINRSRLRTRSGQE